MTPLLPLPARRTLSLLSFISVMLSEAQMRSRESLIKTIFIGLLVFLLLLAGIFVIIAWVNGHFSSVDAMRKYLSTFGAWGPLILALIQALQVVLPVLPGMIGYVAGAAFFGPAAGFWANYRGISAGSILAYWLARWFGIALVKKMVSMEKYESVVRWVNQRKSYTVVLFLAILLPLAPDDFLCYFSGLTAMSAKKFTWIIILGKPWCILMYSLIFARLI